MTAESSRSSSSSEPIKRRDDVVVSVIVPAFNAAHVLGQQLDALALQDAEFAWEVIVGDNGSTDLTADLVRQRSVNFPVPLTLADASARRGASHARNAAIALAGGRVLAFCDADDVVDATWVRMAHEAVTSETPVVTGLLRVLEDPVDPQSKVFRSPVEHGNEIFTANAALLSSVVHEVGGFDESLPPYGVEDSELSIRVIAAGYDINAVLNMVVYFRETNDPHVKMRKIYMSGQAEVVLRARWARDAGRTYGYKALFKELGKIPVESVSAFRDGGVAGGAKWLLRQVPLRVGRLTGYREWYASGKAEHPRLPLLRSQD